MNIIIKNKEYNEYIFFHGITLDKQADQDFITNLDKINIDNITNVYLYDKLSRYCIVGKFNYSAEILELGLSMIEFPFPYVRKKAREVAIANLTKKNYFSIAIPFNMLNNVFDYSLGNEIKSFFNVNKMLKTFKRGSLMYFFKDKKLDKVKKLI